MTTWSSVTAAGVENGPAPPSRSKHSATLLGGYLYLLGGRNGNLPLKDLWRYNLADSKWEEVQPCGERPPALQEHSAVAYKDCLYVFGGELGFSAGTETPLWCYSMKSNSWRKIRAQKGCAVPRGRRGHTALVHRGQMLIYGGYQDLRGSSSELWTFHFETESWHMMSQDNGPPPRHRHTAVLHGDEMYIYGGMTDLQERSDTWRWDSQSSSWSLIRNKNKVGPGPLHGHAACRLPSCMLIFGGECRGSATNELWRFHFATESWEKLTVPGVKPQPRAESVALAISDLVINGNNTVASNNNFNDSLNNAVTNGNFKNNNPRPRPRTLKHINSRTNSRLSFNDPTPTPTRSNFFREISKLSQINLSRLSHPKSSYSVLNTHEDLEMEDPLDANSYYPFQQVDIDAVESTNGMVKSRSVNALARRRRPTDFPQRNRSSATEAMLFGSSNNQQQQSDKIFVPNFKSMALPTPVLTPVEAARLVFVDPDDNESDEEKKSKEPPTSQLIELPEDEIRDFAYLHQACQPIRGDCTPGVYDSIHTPKTPSSKFPPSTSVRFADLEEGEESTSDYASIGARSPGEPLAEDESWQQHPRKFKSNRLSYGSQNFRESQLSFSNPNYQGLDYRMTKSCLTTPITPDARFVKMLNSPPDSLLEDEPGRSSSQTFAEFIEMQEIKPRVPPKSLALGSPSRRAVSASRAERQRAKMAASESHINPSPAPLYVFLVGGKEKGQVTVFSRPVSLWKLQLAPHII